MISKEEYVSKFEEAANGCVNFAEKYLGNKFPRKVTCSLGLKEQREIADKDGKIKFLCGRYLTRDQMENLPVYKAANYTYCDGKTPNWINLYFVSADAENSHIQVISSKEITSQEVKDKNYPSNYTQFRIRLSENGEI